jgi:hypothetical protein
MSEEWQAAVYRLAQKTRQGELSWERDSSGLGPAYRAEHLGDTLKIYHDLNTGMPRLEFIDTAGMVLWSFPPHPSVDDLLMAVEFQVSAVDEKIQKILAA